MNHNNLSSLSSTTSLSHLANGPFAAATVNKNTLVTKSYGVSLPLSTELPTNKDKELTEKLQECLKKYAVFETDSELRHRMDVLHRINTLFKDWIQSISMSKVNLNFI